MISKKTYIPAKPRNRKLVNVSGGSVIGRTDFNQVAGSSHEHPNKVVIDQILQQHLDVLGVLSIVEGNLKIDANAYSTGELSAYGLGSGGSSGGGVDLLQAWTDYDVTKDNWAVKAGLLVPFYNDTKNRLTSLEGGAALSLNVTGSGNAIASLTKSGTALTAVKGNFAELDVNGKILSSQLPAYVDDVLEYVNLAAFPATGETGKIYIAQDSNKTYRWSGTAYVEISASLALGETSSTAYRGDRGKIAYDHSQTEHQAIINGTGFVKANGKTLSYDNNSYSLSSHNHSGIYEPVLGSPSANGYLLSSTTAGVRSWVAPYSLPTASASVLGGVKIGANVSIASGVISVHNPVTIGTANGLSLSTQVLSLALATTADSGALSSTDKTYIDLLKTFFEYDSTNNAIKALKSFYSTGEISAYGIGSGGSSGGSYERLDKWADYDSTKAGWVLSALLGNELNTRVGNLEGGSTLTVNTTGTGNAITSISKAGTVITATKGATFSLDNHLHAGVYEPVFSKNTAFNKNFGTAAGTVAEGNHTHNYLPLSGGTMANTNLVTNLNADLLDGLHSSRYLFNQLYNNSNGWLIKTDVAQSTRAMLTFSIIGNGYDQDNAVINSQVNLYSYDNNSILSYEAVHFGRDIGNISAFVYEGVVCLWIPFQRAYQSLQAYAYYTNSGSQGGYNRVVSISDSALPSTAEGLVTITPKIGAYLTDNVASATKLKTARTIAGVSFDGTANIAIPFANLSSKPTTLAGYGITDAVTLNTAQTITGAKTFSSNVTVNTLNISNTTAASHIEFSRPGQSYITAPLSGGINFITNGDSISGANSMMILSSNGNVGIGKGFTSSTTSITAQLHVRGNILSTGEITAYVASDRRLKHNITPLFSSLDIIDKLNPVSYHWNAKAKELNPMKSDNLDYGLIAQEVEDVLPGVVHGIFDDKYKSIDYIKLIPIMIAAIKELKQKVNKL